MAEGVCKPGWFETPGLQSNDIESDWADDRSTNSDHRGWGMGLVTAVTLAGFSTLAVVTAIGWSINVH